MELKKLGPSHARVPEIGLGTWGYLGGIQPLRAGIEQGAFLIDTAEVYGTEEVVGQAVRHSREQVFLATKVPLRSFRRKPLIAAAERSLRRLGTEYIDLYQLHWPNYTVPIEESMGALEELVDAGKVRFIGVSNFSVRELKRAQAALSKYRIVSSQVRYSLIDRTIEEDLLQYCQQNEITVIAYSPLGTNLQQIRARDPEGMLAQLATRSQKTEAQIALNWLIAKSNVVAIPQSSTVVHIIENCGASGWRLATADYSRLEADVRYVRRGKARLALSRWKRRMLQSIGRQL